MAASLAWFGLTLGIVMLVTIAALVLLTPRVPMRYRVERRLLPCPADGRMAQVDFIYEGAVPVDVLRCSHRPGEYAVTCGRECRSASVAPFAARPSAG